MTNRQARIFAIASTTIAAIIFVVLTLDTHRQIDKLTNTENLTAEVEQGMVVWHKNNCINCHTIFGEGAYYAPDLTKITKHRSVPYLTAYMRDPSQFYNEQKHRRLMPTQDLSEKEIADLISFLDWVSNVDNQGWPPRPIRVTGSGTSEGFRADEIAEGVTPVDSDDDLRAIGQQIFRTAQPACTSCHSTEPDVDMAGPSLAGLATHAAEIIESPDYKGEATNIEEYIRESIVAPDAYLVPGDMYSSGGTSFMPSGYKTSFNKKELEQLTAYLATLK
ncbi:c-type cytochrome [Methylophaga sp.]|uniref:c-type cytochrome n=1 Tax=Methylophaga sp. TaxID=2024840 RepID=UPI003F695959